MDKLTKDLNKKYEGKYEYLKLLSIEYFPSMLFCEITFLFPYTIAEIDDPSRKEIQEFCEKNLMLNAKLKIKFKKSFLDEDLIVKKILEFIEINHKSVSSNIVKEDIKSEYKDLDVFLTINLSNEVKKYFEDNNLKDGLLSFLNKNFIATFHIETVLDENKKIADIIDRPIIPSVATKTPRYSVEIIKKGFGGEILPKPEYIKNITKPKENCIIAGRISNIKKGEFKPKKPKTEDEVRHFYTFIIDDSSAKLPVTIFASHTAEKLLDQLEDNFYLLLQGNIRKGFSDKLTMYARKLSLASRKQSENTELAKNEAIIEEFPDDYVVVRPERILAAAQETLFNTGDQYNVNIINNTFVVFDVETTGLDDKTCEIIELAAVKVQRGVIIEKFQSLIKPKKPIPELITNITSISNDMVANSPSIDKVLLDFYRFSRDCVLSGYNVGFDMGFISNIGQNFGIEFNNEVQDVMAMVRTSGVKTGNLKLGTVVKALNLELKGAHRALNDAWATALVLLKLNEIKK